LILDDKDQVNRQSLTWNDVNLSATNRDNLHKTAKSLKDFMGNFNKDVMSKNGFNEKVKSKGKNP